MTSTQPTSPQSNWSPPSTAPASVGSPSPALLDAPDTTVITGAAGWLGTALVAALADTPDAPGRWARPGRVRALVRNRLEAERLKGLHPNIEPVLGDITRPNDLQALFADLDGGAVDVIHTAGIIHPGRVADFYAVNDRGTANVLAAAAQANVRRFVHVSSNSPFGTNSDPADRFRNDEPYHPYYGYGASKMQGELNVLAAVADGLNAVIVRPPWFYGPYQPPRQTTFFQMVRTGRFPIFGRGDQSRSMVYVDNLVDGVVRAELVPTPPGRGWWIADERPYTVTEIVDTVSSALRDEGYDVSDKRLRVPNAVGVLAERADRVLQASGRYQQQVHVLGEMNKNIACDITVARQELGYEPEVALYEGMRRSIQWCREQGLEL